MLSVVQTLKYLSVVYKLEWGNFVERLLSSSAVKDHVLNVQHQKMPAASDVTHDSFAKGANLLRSFCMASSMSRCLASIDAWQKLSCMQMQHYMIWGCITMVAAAG